MNKSDDIGELASALSKAQESLTSVAKSGHNKFDNYHYSTLEDYIKASKKPLAANGLSVMFSSSEIEVTERKNQKGNTEYSTHLVCSAIVTHSSGQWIEIRGCGEGQDRADKGLYKAITGARKYLMACILNLATSDDPEADETVGMTGQTTSEPTPASATKKNIITKAVESGMISVGFPETGSTEPPPESVLGSDKANHIRALLGERGIAEQDLIRTLARARIKTSGPLESWNAELEERILAWIKRHKPSSEVTGVAEGD